MNKVQRLWVDALRGGKYRQATSTLKADRSFCCLGVLCDLHRKMTRKGFWGKYGYSTDNETDGCQLVESVRAWVGISWPQERDLTNANDGGKNFKEIADMIEGMQMSRRNDRPR